MSDQLIFDGNHPAQRRFVQSEARYPAFISGIGAGKTVGGIGRLIRNVSEWNEGYTGYVIAPTVPSLRNVILPELDKWGVLDRGEYHGTDKRLDLPSGSQVIFESANNERKIKRLRGPSIAWFWMDEAAVIPEQAWDVMLGRLREGDHLNAYITTTPRGENWVYDKFADPDGRMENVELIQGISTQQNPHLPDTYTDEIVEGYEGRFYQQEVEGAFVGFEGLVYPWFSDNHLVDEPPEHPHETIYGVDWGHANPAVILVILRDGDRWVVVDEWYERRCTLQDQSVALTDMIEQWGQGPIYCDPSEPASIEQLKRDGLPACEADNDVQPGIQHIASLSDDLRVHRTCQNLRNEFSQYQYRDGGDSDKVLKQHDHAMDALRYALFTHARTPTSSGREPNSLNTGSWGI